MTRDERSRSLLGFIDEVYYEYREAVETSPGDRPRWKCLGVDLLGLNGSLSLSRYKGDGT